MTENEVVKLKADNATESEIAINTLHQLNEKFFRGHWGDIQLFEDEESRYSNAIEEVLNEIQQYRAYKAIFKNHFDEKVLKLFSNKEEFGAWLERGKWIAKRCDEINKELEQYRAIGTVEEFNRARQMEAVYGQVKWERDTAISQLEEIGVSLGQKMDEFKTLKEKSVEKKAKGNIIRQEAYCPCCNEVISDGEFWALNEYVHHCNECGQAVKGVDWK